MPWKKSSEESLPGSLPGVSIDYSADLFPNGDFGEPDAKVIQTRQQQLKMLILQVSVQMGPTGPIFVKEKSSRIFL